MSPRIVLVAVVLGAVALGLCLGPPGESNADRPPAGHAEFSALTPAAIVTTTLPPPPPPPPPPTTRAPRPRVSRSSGPRPQLGGDVWSALARCESGGNPRAIGGGGRYFGAFQFALGTWHSLGYAGNPIDYPYSTQLEAAQRLVARSGWGQFPHCSRKLGLR